MMNNIQTFTKNTEGRDFVVGDIHGCFDVLSDKLLREFDFNYHKDRLFSVGDLVDRGADSYECLELITEPWFYAVRGNHEDMMIDSVLGDAPPHFHTQNTFMWYQNGGRWAEEYYDEFNSQWEVKLTRLVEKADRLPISIEIVDDDGTPLVGICHAQPLPDWNRHHDGLTQDEVQYILWGRDWVKDRISEIAKKCENIPLVYCGHTPCVQGPKQVGNVRFIDTGACFSKGYLTIEEIQYV